MLCLEIAAEKQVLLRRQDAEPSMHPPLHSSYPWNASFPDGAEEATICTHTKQHDVTVRKAKM